MLQRTMIKEGANESMGLLTGVMNAEGRFAALLADSFFVRKAYDRPLLATPDWVVAPTLGAIVPNWLIAVPRLPALNFRSWRRGTGFDPSDIVEKIGGHLGLSTHRILWFEHGPKELGTDVGC